MAEEVKSTTNGSVNPKKIPFWKRPSEPAACAAHFQTEDTAEASTGWSRAKIVKNLVLISFSSSLLFSGCNTVQKLQSSINLENSLGVASLSVQSGTNMLAGIFLATYTVKGLGTKNTILLCIFVIAIYVASNFYATWYTLMPSSTVVGIAYACIYCAFYTYVSNLATYYSGLQGTNRSYVVSRFFGIFFMALQSSGVIGGVVSYYVLQSPNSAEVDERDNGTTYMVCGQEFCDSLVDVHHSSNFTTPQNEIYLLCGILVALTVAAFLVVWIFVDRIDDDATSKKSFMESLKLLAERQRNIFHILLIPVTIYSGLQLSFITADFTKAYITCSSSVQYVGFVLITYSFSDTIASLLLGQMVQLIGRIGVFLLAAVVDFSMITTMFLWAPDGLDSLYVLFIIAGIWGIGDGVWQGQVKALYGSLFPNHKEPAFCLQGAWECLGITVGYAYSSSLCTKYTLYILMAVLLIGIACYLVAEYLLYKRKAEAEVVQVRHIL